MVSVFRIKGIQLLLTIVIALAQFSHAYGQTADKIKLDQFFDRLSEKNKAMGGLVITKDGAVLYNRSIGYSQVNGSERKPINAATKYRVGSVTKMFTAAMIFQIIDAGGLKLTDHLDKFFPQVPNATKITIAHILAHRSGIHDVSGDQEFRALRSKSVSKDEIIAFIAKSNPDFEPDTKYAYSNSGYFILAAVLEKLTNKSYEETLKERISSKIGLRDTYCGTGNIDTAKNESFSYRYLRDWEQQPVTNISLLFGSGSVISTPADLAIFIHSLFNGKLVSKESLDKMMQDSLGMVPFTYHGKTYYGHTGGIDNFGSWLVYQPGERLAISYSTNAKVYPVAKIIDVVFDILWNKPFSIPSFEVAVISTELLDKYVGIYSTPGAPVKFIIARDSTTLLLQIGDQPAIPLSPAGPDKFEIESPAILFEFDVEKKQMIQKRDGRQRVFTKEN